MSTQITLPCMNGFTLCTDGGNLIVSAKRTEETIPIGKIQSFSLKEPRALGSGTIVFRTAQAPTGGVGIGFGIGVSTGAEKTFFFAKSNLSIAQQLRDYVAGYEPALATCAADGMVVSVVDEIRGLKGLLDDGIITQAEFDAKKAQLLGI